MGDRANVYVKNSEDKGVFLYTHWEGTELPTVVQRALRRKLRWDDDQYLARIIFCEMVKGQEAEETGFGISATMGDNSVHRPILYVDPSCQRIGFSPAPAYGETPEYPSKYWSFNEFIEKEDVSWERL